MIMPMIQEGRSVGFYGAGRSCLSLMSALPLEKCHVTLRSDKPIDKNVISGYRIDEIFEGDRAEDDINEDVIFFSPSVRRERPRLMHALEHGVTFSSDAELFFEENRRPVYAVTGSDGKSTTATLTHLILNEGKKDCPLIGNVGEPMAAHLSDMTDGYVCELSSFMLHYLSPRVRVGCITNINPNHLDWHKDYEEYKETKMRLAKGCDKLVISDDCDYIKGAYAIVSGEKDYNELKAKYKAQIYLTLNNGTILLNGKPILSPNEISIKEKHNIINLMLAIGMTHTDVDLEAVSRVAKSFCGLPHRCQRVVTVKGVECIDSSIDSTPARTAATLKSLDRPVVIILGGRGKRLDYRQMLPELKRYAVEALIVGENADEIASAIGNEIKISHFDSLNEAVKHGINVAGRCGTLLLSPASTSFDRYKSYAERGELFKEICNKMQ